MYSFTFLVSVGVVSVFILLNDIEVTAAPAPHPCLWMFDYYRENPPETTTTTAMPDVLEDLAKLKNNERNQLDKFIANLLLWGPTPSSEDQTQKPRSKKALDRMISGYVKFLTNIVRTL